jgi:hypothetical protein
MESVYYNAFTVVIEGRRHETGPQRRTEPFIQKRQVPQCVRVQWNILLFVFRVILYVHTVSIEFRKRETRLMKIPVLYNVLLFC